MTPDREKLQILFVFFEHLRETQGRVPDPGGEPLGSRSRALELLRDPTGAGSGTRFSMASPMSCTESDGRIMGASTKASSSLVLRQPTIWLDSRQTSGLFTQAVLHNRVVQDQAGIQPSGTTSESTMLTSSNDNCWARSSRSSGLPSMRQRAGSG